MSVHILEGIKINSFNQSGAVLYCSTSGEALAPMFDNGVEAQNFLDWLTVDPRQILPEELMSRFAEWRQIGKPSQSRFTSPVPPTGGTLAAIHNRIQKAFAEASSQRSKYSNWTQWLLFEREQMLKAVNKQMLKAVNTEREQLGLPPTAVDQVARAERNAAGHVDYEAKFVRYCTQLATKS